VIEPQWILPEVAKANEIEAWLTERIEIFTQR